uniref:FHA domain-containing protein n=1 Tax=Agathobacter sp. TaxID=2021311 RepID=UPI0040252FD6
MNDLIKCLTCAIIGVALGIEMKSTDDWRIQAIAIAVSLGILILLSVLFKTDKKEKKSNNVEQKKQTTATTTGEGARITRAEPKTAIETGKKPVRELVLINEEGDVLFTWDIRGKTSLVIGKSTQKEPVDIDLSMSAMSQMISKQHAVLNYTNDGWCIDDIDSKNGTRVRKLSQNAIMDVKLVGSVQLVAGDIIYIASTMLQLR